MTRVEIRQRHSAIGEKAAVRKTLEALGLRRTGARVSHEDSAALRGMIRRVEHLVEIGGDGERAGERA